MNSCKTKLIIILLLHGFIIYINNLYSLNINPSVARGESECNDSRRQVERENMDKLPARFYRCRL